MSSKRSVLIHLFLRSHEIHFSEYYSFRNTSNGSIFIQNVCAVFNSFGDSLEIMQVSTYGTWLFEIFLSPRKNCTSESVI